MTAGDQNEKHSVNYTRAVISVICYVACPCDNVTLFVLSVTRYHNKNMRQFGVAHEI